jgi:uncharacterized protein (TIGR04255 family)
MALNLPDPDTARLPKSPLELVVCQVRFEKRLRAAEAAVALEFHGDLGGSDGPYPRLDEITGQELIVAGGPGIQPSAEATEVGGWRMASEEGAWVVTLMPDHVSLETTRYTTWGDDFEERLNNVINATAKHVEPALEQRLGLRYLDRIKELELRSIQDWEEYVRPELLGPILHPDLGPSVVAAAQQVVLNVNDQVRAALRHGPITDEQSGRVDYLLDYDISRQSARPFDAKTLLASANEFNIYALQLFYASGQDKLFDFLRQT